MSWFGPSCVAISALLLAASSGAASTQSPTRPAFAAKACAAELAAAGARCGTVEVPEDRSGRVGRRIALNVVVLPATPGLPAPPLFDIDGGPGLPDTKNAAFYLTDGAGYRIGSDIVLVDQRGTGQSNGLHCPELAAPEAAFVPMLPVDAVERCRTSLEAKADLASYGTDAAVADLDAVRAALGYPEINLVALSYGTTVALRYLATHPKRVRSAVLMGTSPPAAMPPRNHATAAQRALELLFADCAADQACHAAFPDPMRDLKAALVQVPQSGGGILPEVFLERLRSLMYSAAGARQVPWIVARAAQGDFAPFYAATRPNGPSPFADGMFLSVTCSEALAVMLYAGAASAARATVFGDYRLQRQRDACKAWPSGLAFAAFLRPSSPLRPSC